MEKEPVNQHQQVSHESNQETGGLTMSPPAFQLKSSTAGDAGGDEGGSSGTSQLSSMAPPPFQLQADQPIQRNPEPNQKHTVAPGELPEDIAARYGVTVEALKAANEDLWQAWTPTVQGFNAGVSINIPAGATSGNTTTTTAPVNSTATTTNDVATATTEDSERKKEKLDRVMLIHSSKDNAFAYSRWELSGEGKTSKYATAFEEKIGPELKKEFGKEITHEEVLKMIQDAKDEGDLEKAEDYRKKLWRANQYAMVEALDVDKTSASGKVEGKDALGRTFTSTQNHEMYGKTKHLNDKGEWVNSTYCNIYAHDLATALGAYVPRVWWTKAYEDKAIAAMEAGKAFETEAVYGKGLTEEMSANKLNAWFPRVGENYFGWRKATDMEEAQSEANNGKVVVISAARKGAGSGHISVILAEREEHKAARENDKVSTPLTSQAGSSNYKYKAGSQWWKDSSHKDGGAWIHEGAVDSPLLTPEKMGAADMSGTSTQSADNSSTTTNDATATNQETADQQVNAPVNAGNSNGQPVVENVGSQPETQNQNTNAQDTESKPKDDNTLVISRGIMMMATEGGFGGDSNDVRMPHFPENLAFYRPFTAAELAEIAKLPKNKRPQRFAKRNTDSVKVSSEGTYKRTELLGRHTPGDYGKTPPPGHILATGPNNSGPTIGFGFDIGARFPAGQEAKAKKDLLAAGINEDTAEKLSKGVGLRGLAAGKFAATLRTAGVRITADQAVNLLSVAIPSYVANFTPGVVHPAIEEVLVKINYWKGNGGGKTQVKAIFEAAKAKQGIEQFDAAIAVLKTYSGSTFEVGVKYLTIVKNHIAGGGTVEITTAVEKTDDLTNGTNDTFAVIKEATKTGKSSGKDLQKSLTGNPLSESSGLSSSGSTSVTPTTSSGGSGTTTTASKGLFLSKSVGDGAVNEAADVLKTKQLLAKGGYDVTVNGTADKKFIAALYKFQEDQKFTFKHDGKVEPGKTTEKALFALKDAVQKPVKKAVPEVSPAQRIQVQYDKYTKGEIGMPDLARAVKPFAASSGAAIIALIAKLPASARDNFAYALASNSTNAELVSFDRALLGNMSEQLSSWLTFSALENAAQKARVDKALGTARTATAAAPGTREKTVKKPAPGYTYGPFMTSSDFVSQADPASYPNVPTLKPSELNASSYAVACYDACVAMVKRKGMTVHTNSRIATMLDLKANGETSVPPGALKSGMTQIDALLAQGSPVIVGVDKSEDHSKYDGHTQSNTTANKGRATDHWVVVHAKGVDASGNSFYEFFDPGRYNTAAGTSKNNRLVVNNTTHEAVDSETYSGLTYKMSDVLY